MVRDSGRAQIGSEVTQDERERIDFLRIVLVLLLVLLHFGAIYGSPVPGNVGYAGQDFPVASIFVSFVGFLAYTAVPALSVISGFLFFRGAGRDAPPAFGKLIGRRLKTLIAPFLIWSGGFILLAYGLFVAGGFYPSVFAPEDGSLVRSLADAWLGLTDAPLAIQLWFVRDLILTIALSPAIWFCVSRAPIATLGIILALWLSEHTLWIFHRLDVVGFFCLGAAFAMHGWRRHLPDSFVAPLAAIFLVMVLARAVAPAFLENPEESWGLYAATCLMRIVGVAAIWSAAPFLMVGGVKAFAARYAGLAFFVHCAHYPPILFVKTAFGTLAEPQSDAGHLALYVASAALTFLGVYILARLLHALAPGLFAILSGGRAAPLVGSYARATA